ncbi:MAG: hypothetical protein V4717_06705 [Bacteroidota bacterium]
MKMVILQAYIIGTAHYFSVAFYVSDSRELKRNYPLDSWLY